MDSSCILDLRLLLAITVDLDVPLRAGNGPYGYRSAFGARRGSFEFDGATDLAGIRGVIIPGPADFCLRDRDTQSRWLTCDVRGVLETITPPRVVIYMHYTNCVPFSDKDADDLAHGAVIDYSRSHFIVSPRLEVGDTDKDGNKLPKPFASRVMRLNATPLVAHGRLRPQGVDYRVYEIVNRDDPSPH